MKLKRVRDAFTAPLTAGIFKALETSYALPWESDVSAETLDFEYFLNHSGEKLTSPAIDALLASADTYTGILTDADISALAAVLWAKFETPWEKLYATLSLQYNPIENYDRTEEKTGTDTLTETPHNWTETETQTPTNWKETETQTPTNWTETETQTPTNWKETTEGADTDNESTTTTQKYGFNSSDPVNDGIAVTKSKDKHTSERTGTYETETERTGTYETETTRTGKYETERERTGTYEHETEYDTKLHIHGNIGVTTSQQMIESERNLWMWQYFEQVFMDVDSVLACKVY